MKSTIPISKIKTEFSLQNATSFGGVKVFLDFLEKIKLPTAMRGLSGGKAHNAVFPLHHILPYLLVGWMLGCERIFHFRKLQHDALLRRFLGGCCPHHSLLYKELIRLGRSCPELAHELRMLNQAIIRCGVLHLALANQTQRLVHEARGIGRRMRVARSKHRVQVKPGLALKSDWTR